MAITTVTGGSAKLRAVRILKGCLGPGGAPLTRDQKVRIPESDAYTLVASGQAEHFVEAVPAEDKGKSEDKGK